MPVQTVEKPSVTLAELEPSAQRKRISERSYNVTGRQRATVLSPEQMVLEYLTRDIPVGELNHQLGLQEYKQRSIDSIIARVKRGYGCRTLTGAVAAYLTRTTHPAFVRRSNA